MSHITILKKSNARDGVSTNVFIAYERSLHPYLKELSCISTPISERSSTGLQSWHHRLVWPWLWRQWQSMLRNHSSEKKLIQRQVGQ